ncbi:MAG: hypothetical protein JRI68_13820 [Deltaproteobacteria bacterium]|nr:hypothetical protein [Deltaproteobacteria bacterium]
MGSKIPRATLLASLALILALTARPTGAVVCGDAPPNLDHIQVILVLTDDPSPLHNYELSASPAGTVNMNGDELAVSDLLDLIRQALSRYPQAVGDEWGHFVLIEDNVSIPQLPNHLDTVPNLFRDLLESPDLDFEEDYYGWAIRDTGDLLINMKRTKAAAEGFEQSFLKTVSHEAFHPYQYEMGDEKAVADWIAAITNHCWEAPPPQSNVPGNWMAANAYYWGNDHSMRRYPGTSEDAADGMVAEYGLVRDYAGSIPHEDMAETLAYLFHEPAVIAAIVNQGSDMARAIMASKLLHLAEAGIICEEVLGANGLPDMAALEALLDHENGGLPMQAGCDMECALPPVNGTESPFYYKRRFREDLTYNVLTVVPQATSPQLTSDVINLASGGGVTLGIGFSSGPPPPAHEEFFCTETLAPWALDTAPDPASGMGAMSESCEYKHLSFDIFHLVAFPVPAWSGATEYPSETKPAPNKPQGLPGSPWCSLYY